MNESEPPSLCIPPMVPANVCINVPLSMMVQLPMIPWRLRQLRPNKRGTRIPFCRVVVVVVVVDDDDAGRA